MDNHYRQCALPEDALRVRAQHPAMKNRMAALAHDNETGLDSVRLMDNLFRGVAQDDIRFEFNILLPGTLMERDENALKALAPLIEDRMEFRALGGSGGRIIAMTNSWLSYPPPSKGQHQSVLRVWRRIECNKYPLNSNKTGLPICFTYPSSAGTGR